MSGSTDPSPNLEATPVPITPAASRLLGLTLEGGWTVVAAIPKGALTTGGYFSYGYLVESSTGQRAFLKALDLSAAFNEPNFVEAINSMTSAYLYERDLLFRCRDRNLSRVVRALDQGTVTVPGAIPPQVHYLIFELASGDVRQQLAAVGAFDTAFALRTVHQAAVGISQLHRIGIAHQDLKPSNVLLFGEGDAGRRRAREAAGGGAKVADLGRASSRGAAAVHDDLHVAGDTGYAPPELLYGQVSEDWAERRMACDLYHLGSLTLFMFTLANMTPAWKSRLPRPCWPENWGGTYREVLPHIQAAFEEVLTDLGTRVPSDFATPVTQAVRELCNPDPALRGHPRNHRLAGNRFDLQRYISLFDRLAFHALYGRTG